MEMTIQEVKQLDKDSYQIIDIRDDNEIAHGAIPGAVALKVEEIAENPLVDKSKKLVICCSRGKYSQEVVPELIEKGLIGKEKNTDKLLAAIEESKKKEPQHLLAGLGIPNVGKATARELMQHFGSIEKLEAATVEELEEVPDIGQISAC